MTLVVIGYRKFKGKKYRTRYYIECRDGRPMMGARRRATAFDEKEAEATLAQLNALQPTRNFETYSMTARPPRFKGEPPPEPPKPIQTDAFE